MLNAASTVLAASSYSRYLEKIISEAVQANRAFERMARRIESSGYELRICLDLTTYAHVHPRDSGSAENSARYARQAQMGKPSAEAMEGIFLPLSDPDAQFLKALRISAE